MDNLFKKIETELDSLPFEEREEILKKLRDQVDGLDKEIVNLLNRRTLRSVMIGKVKKSLGLPTYNPDREKQIAKRIASFAEEPLTKEALERIYERIIDESRAVQKTDNKIKSISNKAGVLKEFSHLLTKKQYLIVFSFFILLLIFFTWIFFTPNYYSVKEPVQFEIEKGESLSQIVDNLYEEGVISNKFNLKVATFITGAEKNFRAARYHIPNGLSYLGLINLFTKGDADFLRDVNIREGLTFKWMAWKIHKEALVDSSDFVNLAENSNFCDSLGIKANTLMGYLMPGDYGIYERSSADEVIHKMFQRFQNFWVDSLKNRAKEMGYSVHQILTLASIVKGETNRVSDMPKIAALYLNRLKIGMRLQADPTIQFIQRNGWKRLNYNDLKTNSPYNTYKHAGLPPGPINNPGKNSILSVLYPDNNKFLYMVADGDGGHIFSKTYSEHLRAVAKYKKWLRAQKNR